jgi:acylpyruvate hydrolase
MKLVTYLCHGEARLGARVSVDGEMFVLDLNRAQPSLPTEMVAFLRAGDQALDLARGVVGRAEKGSLQRESYGTLLAPLPRPGKIICIGHNYLGHSGATPPAFPDVFAKFANVVIGPREAIVMPTVADQVDYEGELAVVIGKSVRHVSQAQALSYVAGYTIFNDVTARDFQRRSSQWTLGKTFDTFGPMGPALVTADEIPDPGMLDLSLEVNGDIRQCANTRDLIFSIPFLVAYLSDVMTLEPGDVIATGTPDGTGASRRPPVFLTAGDVVTIRVERIGELSNPVVTANG